MKKIIYLNPAINVTLTIFFTFAFSASALSADSKINQYSKNPTVVSPTAPVSPVFDKFIWPLPVMEKKEREALLKFFIPKYDFKLESFGGHQSVSQCQTLLQNLKSFQNTNVLSPTNTQWRFPPQSGGENLPSAKCSNLHELAIFSNWSGNAASLENDTSFARLSIFEKRKVADVSYRPTANVEYFDLSNFFGANSWGVMGEGVIRDENIKFKKTQRDFKPFSMIGYGAVALIFNSETCQAQYFTQPLFAPRLVNVNNQSYRQKPTVFAFLEISTEIYLATFLPAGEWSSFAELTKRGASGQLSLVKVMSPNREPAAPPQDSNENSCNFIAK